MVLEQDLDEFDARETSSLPLFERRLVTQAYDLSVNTLIEQWDDGTLVIPKIQREYVWDDARASRLIESLLLNIPIPVLYFFEREDSVYEIVDGHQRINSIVRFIKNQFKLTGLRVLGDFSGRRFFELSERDQRQIKTRVIRAIIVGYESHSRIRFQIFERLNTGSIALNTQEIRNALYQGVLNDILEELELD